MPSMFFPQSSQVFSGHPAILADAVLVLACIRDWPATSPAAGSAPGYLAKVTALSVGPLNAYFKSLRFPLTVRGWVDETDSNRRVRTRMHGGVPMGRVGPSIVMKLFFGGGVG